MLIVSTAVDLVFGLGEDPPSSIFIFSFCHGFNFFLYCARAKTLP